MRISMFVFSLALAIVFGARAQEQTTGIKEERELGGWVVSGKSVTLSALDPSRRSTPAGELMSYCPTRRINDLLVTGDTLWIATEGGLFAYGLSEDSLVAVDGPRVGSINAVAMDDEEVLWVGGENGLAVRSGSGWKHYTEETRSFFSRLTDIVVGESRVWISTYGNGCGYVSDGMLHIYTRADSLLDDRVECFAEEGDRAVWFGTASGLCWSDSLQWKSMRYGQRLPVGSIRDMLIDEEGNLFLAIQGQGVATYNLGRVRIYRPGRGLPSKEVEAFSLDPFGKVWAAGRTGLSVFDGSGWVPYRLPGVPIGRYDFLSIQHDAEGNCYLGTDEGLVLVLGRESMREIELPKQLPAGTVSPLRSSGDDIWFTDGDAAYRYGTALNRIDPPDKSYENSLSDILFVSERDFWITSRFGILHFDGANWQIFDRRQRLPTENFLRVVRDGEGILWFGTFDRGILGFTGRNWIHHWSETGLPDDRIDDLVVDANGDLWIITASGRISRRHAGSFEELPLPAEHAGSLSAAASDSLEEAEPFVRFLSSGKEGAGNGSLGVETAAGLDGPGNIILADARGIYRFAGSDWQIITLPEGFGTINPTAVLGSARGRIWLGTADKGVFVRSRSGWARINSFDGLIDEDVRSLAQDPSGNIWIGTRRGGVARFAPAR
jgi:ligand-binding sensor domain-containing protein